MRKQGIKNFARNVAASAIVAVAALGSTGAFATDAFDDAVTASSAKITLYGAALVGVAAVGVAAGIGMKYVKRIKGAA